MPLRPRFSPQRRDLLNLFLAALFLALIVWAIGVLFFGGPPIDL